MKTSLEVLTWLTLLAQAVYVQLVWSSLPAMMPSHFGRGGIPNAYVPRFTLWILIAVSVLVVAAIGIIQQFPEMFNLPQPPRHPDRQRIEEVASTMLVWIRLEVAAIFITLLWSIVNIDSTQSTAAGVAITLVCTMVVLLTIFFAVVRMKATPAEAQLIPAGPRAVPFHRSVRSTASVAPVTARLRPSGR